MVLQALDGLSDREAVSALRRDIAWKVACGLRLDDEGVHPTVLVYWRNRIRASQRPRRIFDAVGHVIRATGVLSGRGRRVLDSTILEDAVATQETVTQLVAAIRRVRRLVPEVRGSSLAPTTMTVRASPTVRGTTPTSSRRWSPGWSTTRWRAGGTPGGRAWRRAGRCGRVAGAGRRPGRGGGRAAGELADRPAVRPRPVISTVDPQARHTRKTSASKRDGYKGHIAAEPETGLVTECALTAATVAEGPTGVQLLAGELPGLEVLGDGGYGSGQTRAAPRAAGHTQTIKPAPLAAAVPGGFTIHDFQVDPQAGTVTCPAGYRARLTKSGQARFARHCQRCPLRQRCTTATDGRTIRVHPHDGELRAARRRTTTRSFQQSYRRRRPMVERSLA
jgi:hypothetical protein